MRGEHSVTILELGGSDLPGTRVDDVNSIGSFNVLTLFWEGYCGINLLKANEVCRLAPALTAMTFSVACARSQQ